MWALLLLSATAIAGASDAMLHQANYTTAGSGGPRLIGYVENWGWGTSSPPSAALSNLTDVILAFGVSYTGDATTSPCAKKQCALHADPISFGNPNLNTLAKSAHYLKTAGGGNRRVLLSVGGFSMGNCARDGKTGKYTNCQGPADATGDANCWQYCFADPYGFAKQMVTLAQSNGFDGIDLDYEGQKVDDTWSFSDDERRFLVSVTSTVRGLWPSAVISHTLMEVSAAVAAPA